MGRERELTELNAALEGALSGQGRLVMLAGEPGIGKTRTAQELAVHAENLGAQVWWGRCYEAPYWPSAESRRLADALEERGNYRYTEVLAFEHVRPASDGLW